MTRDEAIAQALGQFDEIVSKNLDDYDDMLRSFGATDEEREIALANARRDNIVARADFVIQVRRCIGEADDWLRRGGRELQ